MAVEKEIWINDIQENLFQGNEFMGASTDHSGFISVSTNGTKIVHVPQAGSNPSVEINRSGFPATASRRTDTDLTYQIDNYSTDPIQVLNYQNMVTSYDKRMSVMGQHIEVLRETLGNNVINKWAENLSAAKIVNTTGANTSTALAPSATGTRNRITMDDVRSAASLLDKDNIPMNNRYMLLPVDLYYELVGTDAVAFANRFGNPTQQDGVVDSLYGFSIMTRPTVNVYSDATTIKAVGAAGAATDNYGAFFWHSSTVALADAGVDVHIDSGDSGSGNPLYYGSVISAEVNMGAKQLRTDLKGVGAIVQGV
jgi:hypothetical protein